MARIRAGPRPVRNAPVSPKGQNRFDEFELIGFLKRRLSPDVLDEGRSGRASEGLKVGIGDDGAVLEIPDGQQLVVSMDTLVEDVHFRSGVSAHDLGYKALAVNLSDLAAMGAQPAWYFLALTLPEFQRAWAEDFCDGIGALSAEFGIVLAGGDVTRGPLSVTVTVCGTVEGGCALTRSGARIGDRIAVSGTTGLAGKALADLSHGKEPVAACSDALHRPVPRVALGRHLVGFANSCIDISDGLLADLGHILSCSGVGGVLELNRLPGHPVLDALSDEDRWNLQMGGGDDYELCFTFSADDRELLASAAGAAGIRVTEIGSIVEGTGCRCLRPDGSEFEPEARGYVHGADGGSDD